MYLACSGLTSHELSAHLPHAFLSNGIQYWRFATRGPRCENQEGCCHEDADQEEQDAMIDQVSISILMNPSQSPTESS